MTDNNKVISQTFRKDGTLATCLISEGVHLWLFQYDHDGQVTFSQKLDSLAFEPTDITYHDGCVATVTHNKILSRRTISQYDAYGHITSSITLEKNDMVNFSETGYIRSVTKFIDRSLLGAEMEEMQFNDNGYMVSCTHKVKMGILARTGIDKWLTTEAKQYYPDGKLLTHITYAQKTSRSNNLASNAEEDKAASFIASITQYSETGKLQISAQLSEHDEVNFNGEKIACIIKRVQKSDGSLETTSVTTYYASGNICTMTAYKDGKIISSVTYDETGKPQSNAQQGNEEYQDIFKNVNKKQAIAEATKEMFAQQAANILDMPLNVTKAELKKAHQRAA